MTNRFKGLDLIDRVPEDLWTEVCDIVQQAEIKTIPKKGNAKVKGYEGGSNLDVHWQTDGKKVVVHIHNGILLSY